MLRLRLGDFIEWLASKHPDDIVGYSRCGYSCPLARFIREKTGQQAFVSGYTIVVGDDTYLPPSWAAKFVRAVDKFYHSKSGVGVSAEDALRIVAVVQGQALVAFSL